jgi:hypothetical protein
MFETVGSLFPLVHLNSPLAVWDAQPHFLLYECLYHYLWASVLVRVFRRRPGEDPTAAAAATPVLLLASLCGGAISEFLTVLPRQIGNFYHSQAVVMLLGRREPAYMLLGCYNWLFVTSVAAGRLFSRALAGGGGGGGKAKGGGGGGGGVDWAAEAAFAALCGSCLNQVNDLGGLAYAFWSFHWDEPLYRDREGGVPVASGFWVLAYVGGLALATRAADTAVGRLPRASGAAGGASGAKRVGASVALALLAGASAALVLMHAPFVVFYHPLVTWLGLHASWALLAARLACAAVAVRAALRSERVASGRLLGSSAPLPSASAAAVERQQQQQQQQQQLPTTATATAAAAARVSWWRVFEYDRLLFLGFMLWLTWGTTPAGTRSESFHQVYGCALAPPKEGSLWGAFERERGVCAATTVVPQRDHYDFSCLGDGDGDAAAVAAALPREGTAWYVQCGVEPSAVWRELQTATIIAAAALLATPPWLARRAAAVRAAAARRHD